MTPQEINQQIFVPEEDKATPIKVNEAAFIYDFLMEKGIKKTLETGFAYGRSASHIMAATGSRHIAIDPFQEKYSNIGLQNIQKLGFEELLDFKHDYSHNILPLLNGQKKKFEFIFIDGDHKFDGIFNDFYYADMLLEQGSYVLFHDTWMRSTQLVVSFIKKNRTDYKQIKTPLRNFLLFQKTGNDNRNGMVFREFYTFKSFFVHKVILWLSNGKESRLKKMLFYLKEKVK
jgi:predicted O-methyltransferase YrrM